MLAETRIAPRPALVATSVLLVSISFLLGRVSTSGGKAPSVPGPARTVNGVGVGFAHSEAGAEAAAGHDLLELERAIDTLDVRRTTAVARMVATSAEGRVFESHAAAAVAVERSDGAPLRRVAISTGLASYSPAAAQVTVLECWVYATAAREALWAIERVSLVWQHRDWRVNSITGAAPSVNESLDELRSELEFPGPGDATVR
jgi:hypothetical protein